MARSKIPEAIQQQVRRRANYLCEYCHASELWQYVRFTVDHVVPVIEGGPDNLENLALACFHCNRCKWKYQQGVDPSSGEAVSLFNPCG
jgi:5-methylcytosine-specific restriction endonuclease McrA